ncbi:hypothetical protein BV98_000309 [Sphingobium herbicidovorans NBRC 16415]|jgi:hypothetical protein|uniref:Uncharacterized protein n=1 Tax=Sphingobium herbicidovorans (strain ATCC 700291 / DSM 11019 / CCUG 56400 / KCTC 2939 / LMG 18315 / NBRC 16415 / MH) TaxID=1219045 RepID=A0A086PF90_SPHHM|nr:hypothetical protein BV98_000309 [Sphingobium herbicidovorans NBRC 16415]
MAGSIWRGLCYGKGMALAFGQQRSIDFLQGPGIEEKEECAAKIMTAIKHALRHATFEDQGKRSEESP